MAIPVVAPRQILFRMRFVKADGRPIANVSFQIRWGHNDDADVAGQTDSDGWVEEELNGRYREGFLYLGDPAKAENEASFTKRVAIPITLYTPPAPPARAAPSEPPELPEPPRELERLDRGGESEPQADPGLVSMGPETRGLIGDFNASGRRRGTRMAPPTSPTPPAEAPKDYVMINYKKQKTLFALAWRLHNLAFLVWDLPPRFPLRRDEHYPKLLDALDRYTFKYNLKPVTWGDLLNIEDLHAEVLAHIYKLHDQPHHTSY